MKHCLIVFMTTLSFALCSRVSAANPIDFQPVKTGANLGHSPLSTTTQIIDNNRAFASFCETVRLNTQTIQNQPDFDKMQLICIVYNQSSRAAGHTINAINENNGIVSVEVTCHPVITPSGIIQQPGYVYQIVAIQRQASPINFTLNPQAATAIAAPVTNRSIRSSVNSASLQTFDLRGRVITSCAKRLPFALQVRRIDTRKTSIVLPNNKY
jgi:hypothetical protein